MEFNGKKVKIPWGNWETVEISPEGIHTYKGVINPRELDLLQWKAGLASAPDAPLRFLLPTM